MGWGMETNEESPCPVVSECNAADGLTRTPQAELREAISGLHVRQTSLSFLGDVREA